MTTVVKTFTGSGSINFEDDKQNSLTKVNDAESLSEQALKLKAMEKDLASLTFVNESCLSCSKFMFIFLLFYLSYVSYSYIKSYVKLILQYFLSRIG